MYDAYDAYDALELAKYIVTKCIKDHCPISNLQLQKILFFIQREFLQKKGRSAFHDPIQAWKFGPVVRKVYVFFCVFGGMPIDLPLEFIEGNIDWHDSDKSFIDGIVDRCRKLDPWQLVAETHKPGGAWDQTYCRGIGVKDTIDIDRIRQYG